MHSKLCAGQHPGRITCGLILPTVGIMTNYRAYSRRMPVRQYICSALWAGSHPRCIPCGAAELVGIVEAPGVHSPAACEAERMIAPCRHRYKLQAARSRTGHLRSSLLPASQPNEMLQVHLQTGQSCNNAISLAHMARRCRV